MRTTRIRGGVLARLVACAALSLAILTATVRMAAAAPVPGSYDWPVRGRVMRPFVAPAGQFGPGHRGIDIEAPFGSVIVAPQDGVVGFAGWVAGSQFVSIDHPDGVRTTYSWLSGILVRRGDPVARGHAIARTGHGHSGDSIPHLHFGARFEGEYIDPMLLLQRAEVRGLIRLAPLDDDGGGSASSALPTLAEFVGGRSAGFEAPAGFEGSTRTMAARPDRECARCRLTTHMTFPGPAGTGARGPPGGLAGHRIDAPARPLRPVRQAIGVLSAFSCSVSRWGRSPPRIPHVAARGAGLRSVRSAGRLRSSAPTRSMRGTWCGRNSRVPRGTPA